jgi:WD40 repeat protein
VESLPHELQGATFDRTHQSLLTFGRDRFARLLNAATGTPLLPPLEHLSFVQNAVFSPDGTRFATGTSGGRARVWSTETGEPLTPWLDHNGAAGPVEFSASGRCLFTLHPAHAVYVWDLSETNEPPVLLRPGTPGTFTESDQQGSVSVTRNLSGPIRVRALAGAAEVSLHPSSLMLNPVQAWFDRTGQFIILQGEKRQAQIWDVGTGLPVTPSFRSRYATNETEYRTATLSTFSLAPSRTKGRGEGASDKSEIRNGESETQNLRLPTSDLRSLAELLSGSRLDGSGGWIPLELSEVVARWNMLDGRDVRPVRPAGSGPG